MEMDEAELIRQIAQLPTMSVSGTPLFFLIIAMSLPSLLEADDLEEWGPFLRDEAKKMTQQIYDKLPPEAKALAKAAGGRA